MQYQPNLFENNQDRANRRAFITHALSTFDNSSEGRYSNDAIALLEAITLELQEVNPKSIGQPEVKWLIDFANKNEGLDYSIYNDGKWTIKSTIKNFILETKNHIILAIWIVSAIDTSFFEQLIKNAGIDEKTAFFDIKQPYKHHDTIETDKEYNIKQPLPPQAENEELMVMTCINTLVKSKLLTMTAAPFSKFLGRRLKYNFSDSFSVSVLADANMTEDILDLQESMLKDISDNLHSSQVKNSGSLMYIRGKIDGNHKHIKSTKLLIKNIYDNIDGLSRKRNSIDSIFEAMNELKSNCPQDKTSQNMMMDALRITRRKLSSSHDFVIYFSEKLNKEDPTAMEFLKQNPDLNLDQAYYDGYIRNKTLVDSFLSNNESRILQDLTTYLASIKVSVYFASRLVEHLRNKGRINELIGLFDIDMLNQIAITPYEREILMPSELNLADKEETIILSKTNWYTLHCVAQNTEKTKPWPVNSIVLAVALSLFGYKKEEIVDKMNSSLHALESARRNPEVYEMAEDIVEHYSPEELWCELDQRSNIKENTMQSENPKSPQAIPQDNKQEKAPNLKTPTKSKTVLTSAQLKEVNILARTLYKEARGESLDGIKAVASVIYNRGGGKSSTMVSKVQAPKQFSCWNETDWSKYKITEEYGANWATCKSIATQLVDGTFTPTTNATHYLNPNKASPSWAKNPDGTWKTHKVIGNHIFLRV